MFGTRRTTATAIGAVVAAASVLAPAGAVSAAHDDSMHDGSAQLHHAEAFPHARGPVIYHSDFDSHHAGMDEEFHLVLRGVKRLAGQRVRVFVHGDLMGRAHVNDDGHARLHRHDGVGDLHDGWAIRVRTRSGKLVAYASFHEHVDDHG